jgi:hypothetical protein
MLEELGKEALQPFLDLLDPGNKAKVQGLALKDQQALAARWASGEGDASDGSMTSVASIGESEDAKKNRANLLAMTI